MQQLTLGIGNANDRALFLPYSDKLANVGHCHPSLIFAGKATSLPLEWSPVNDPLW